MKVKICGITRLEDALLAVEAGADLLGFNFYPKSPRYLSPDACSALTFRLRQRGCTAKLVGVFVNASQAEMVSILVHCHLDLAQCCGDEPPAVLAEMGEKAFKALRPPDAAGLQAALAQLPARTQPPALLIDAYRPGLYGGSGQTADWSLAASLAQQMPILLAGGLTPENVGEAVRQVAPWGVDVASGVESAPAIKDGEKMLAFIRAAKPKE
jgi:phosphoribosylanthranilate isomerase